MAQAHEGYVMLSIIPSSLQVQQEVLEVLVHSLPVFCLFGN